MANLDRSGLQAGEINSPVPSNLEHSNLGLYREGKKNFVWPSLAVSAAAPLPQTPSPRPRPACGS